MLTLFPQYRLGLGISWLLTAAVAGFMIRSGAAWYWPLAVVLICGFAALALAELGAASQHQKLLLILYQKGDPRTFIQKYEPLLKQRCSSASRALTLRAYLSNAYLAMGDCAKARRLLDDAPTVNGREADNAAALLAGNQCSIFLQIGDAAGAVEQLELLRRYQGNPNVKKELTENIPLLQVRCDLLSGSVHDTDLLEQAVREAVSPLRKADNTLVLAQTQLAQKHKGTARKTLEPVLDGNPDLWAVRQARRLKAELDGIPGEKPEKQ